jgi:predicted transcriptional regulator
MSVAFTIRLDETTLGALDRLAEKTERSRNWLVAKAVEDYVSLNAWQLEKIEAGIRAADAGDFANDAELERLRQSFADKE